MYIIVSRILFMIRFNELSGERCKLLMRNDTILQSIISDVYDNKRMITLLQNKETREELVSYLQNTETDAAVFVAREILIDKRIKNQDVRKQATRCVCRRIGAEESCSDVIDWHDLEDSVRSAFSVVIDETPQMDSAMGDKRQKKTKLANKALETRILIDYVVSHSGEWYPDKVRMNLDSVFQSEKLLSDAAIRQALLDAVKVSGYFYLQGDIYGAIHNLNSYFPQLVRFIIEEEDDLSDSENYVYPFIETLVKKRGTKISEEIVDALYARIDEIAACIRKDPFYNPLVGTDGRLVWTDGNLLMITQRITRLGSDERIQTAISDWARRYAYSAYDAKMRGYLPPYVKLPYPNLRYEREFPNDIDYIVADEFDIELSELGPTHWIKYAELLSEHTYESLAGLAYFEALSLNPQTTEAWQGLGQVLIKLGFTTLGNAVKQIPDGVIPSKEIGKDLHNFIKDNSDYRLKLYFESRILRTAPYCDLPPHTKKWLTTIENNPTENRNWYELGLKLKEMSMHKLGDIVQRVDENIILRYGDWVQLNDFLETHNCVRALDFIYGLRECID